MNMVICSLLLLNFCVPITAYYPEQDLLYSFLKPVKCTRSGLRCFMRHTFNQKMYAQEFMPLSFMHMVDLLTFGKKLEKPRSFIESVFSLFHERFQEARYANPYAVHELLEQLPALIEQALHTTTHLEKEKMQEHLTRKLKDNFNDLKLDPHKFLFEITDELYNLAHQEEDLSVEQTQYMITRFIDQACNKIIFDPREQHETWTIFKQLLDDIVKLQEHGILQDTKTANHQLWALVYRYEYFINCAGSELSLEYYQQIKEELQKNTPSALLIEEQEELLTTKLVRLQHIITEGEVKARAKSQGIITDTML